MTVQKLMGMFCEHKPRGVRLRSLFGKQRCRAIVLSTMIVLLIVLHSLLPLLLLT